MTQQQRAFWLRILYGLIMLVSALLAVVGLSFLAMYVWEAVISRWGEADQSLLFWYLPILFIGAFSFMGGVVLFVYSLKKYQAAGILKPEDTERRQ